MMTHAYQMFTHFSTILKHSKKDDCKYTDQMIDEICADFALLSVLWDGALSLASKVNPRSSDIELFKRYVRAATFTHQAMSINITHKVHLMSTHIAFAMKIPGGLGKKREDWIEQGHQAGSLVREHYRSAQNQEVRANAIAGATHRDSDPRVLARIKEVNREAKRGPRVGYTTKEVERRLERERNREEALASWETLNSHVMLATAGTVLAELPPFGNSRVVN